MSRKEQESLTLFGQYIHLVIDEHELRNGTEITSK